MKAFKVVSQVFCSASCAVAFATASYGGTLTVQFGSAMEVIEGGVTNTYAKDETFVPTAIPCIYKMRPGGMTESQRTFAITGTDQIRSANVYRFPVYGDGNWVRVALNPYPSSDTTVTLTGIKATGTFYVDAEHGNDDWDGKADYEHRDESVNKGPKKTLQAANDAATGNYPIVLAAPGRYDEGGAVATYGSGSSASSSNRRLFSSKNIGFIATEGAENTFIVGAPDPTTGGNGADAVGGVFMKTTSHPSFIQGFTITGCYSPASQTGIGHYGSAFCGSGSYRSYCLDCVISNNYAVTKYPATCYGVIQRSKIMENESRENTTLNGWFSSCVFAGNRITGSDGTSVAYAIHNQSYTYFCTYDLRNANQPSGRKRLDGDSTLLREGLVYGLTDKTTISSAAWFDSQAIDNPIFADADARDYRLGALSPAIDACSYESNLSAASRIVMTADIDGRMPVLHDGMMRLGAVWNEPPLPVTVLYGQSGGMSVSGASLGTNIVSTAGEITVTATDAATRQFLGFEVNGEMVSAPSGSYSFTPSTAAGSVTKVKAIYDTEWYVDCVNGNDANPGTAALPKRTIRAATTNAVSGDVIHVAPGTYGALEGAEKYKAAASSLCRVIIPSDVTVESTEGAEKTFIVGAPADVENANDVGNGPGAIRCVYAYNGATLTGFTLTGGHTAANKDADTYDIYGAALLTGSDTKANINDCIISNNYSHYATIFRSTVRRSRIIGNIGGTGTGTSTVDGSAGSGCSYYNCIIDGNKGNGTILYSGVIESCTIGTNLMHNNGSAFLLRGNSTARLLNSLFRYGSDRFYNITLYATNCIFRRTEASGMGLIAANCSNCLFNTTVSVTDYKPAYGSKAIDAGDNSIATYDIASETDILGTPRALNGRIDIGAIEYDWRPKFAQELGKRVTIDYASPSVATNATGGLLMPSGEVVGRVAVGGKCSFTFDIPSGTVEAFVGGVSAGTLASVGEQTITVDIPDAETEFRLVFTPDAEAPEAAVLKKIASNRGFVLIYR